MKEKYNCLSDAGLFFSIISSCIPFLVNNGSFLSFVPEKNPTVCVCACMHVCVHMCVYAHVGLCSSMLYP